MAEFQTTSVFIKKKFGQNNVDSAAYSRIGSYAPVQLDIKAFSLTLKLLYFFISTVEIQKGLSAYILNIIYAYSFFWHSTVDIHYNVWMRDRDVGTILVPGRR